MRVESFVFFVSAFIMKNSYSLKNALIETGNIHIALAWLTFPS